MYDAGDCPRCKLATQEGAEAMCCAVAEDRLLGEIETHLAGLGGGE